MQKLLLMLNFVSVKSNCISKYTHISFYIDFLLAKNLDFKDPKGFDVVGLDDKEW